ncbi:MAG: modification methylase [Desulfobacteraceae bacterium IS3]|nr:MAG: modification methylase [Desulfobacteraceae bacterium IS3]
MTDIEKDILYTNIPEKQYAEKVAIDHRKKYAQFFTPFPVALFMAKWITSAENCSKILEPAFGLGIFSRAMLKLKDENLKIVGFETDNVILKEATIIVKPLSDKGRIEIIDQDYLYSEWEDKYDGILCNPPYFKFHDYDNKSALNEINRKLGISLNGFTNLYALFLLKSIYQLNDKGRAAYIIPSEFMNSDYGKNVKSFLLKSNTLRYVIIFDFNENLFDDALTTASILLLAKDNCHKEVKFITVQSKEDVDLLSQMIETYPAETNLRSVKTFKTESINADLKWRSYYKNSVAGKYKNLVPLSLYGKVVRGIATGDNDYFIFNREKQKKYSIKNEYLLPCITKANDVSVFFFTKEHFEKLKDTNKNIFLIDLNKAQDKNLFEYIRIGEEKGVHKKYLTSKRNPWYALENRPPSPIWISVFNRKEAKFIRNEAAIYNLTAFHCMYMDMLYESETDLLFAYLLTDIAKEIINDNRREYGNGLKKFEPNDLNHSKMVDLKSLDRDLRAEILQYYQGVRKSEADKTESSNYLHKLNEIFERILKN